MGHVRYVIVVISGDGTVSVVGTKAGHPFSSYKRAEPTASAWNNGDFDVTICSIDTEQEPTAVT